MEASQNSKQFSGVVVRHFGCDVCARRTGSVQIRRADLGELNWAKDTSWPTTVGEDSTEAVARPQTPSFLHRHQLSFILPDSFLSFFCNVTHVVVCVLEQLLNRGLDNFAWGMRLQCAQGGFTYVRVGIVE